MTEQEAITQALSEQLNEVMNQLISVRATFARYRAEHPPQEKQPE